MRKSDCFTIDVSIQDGKPYLGNKRTSILRMPRSHWYSLFYPPIMQADPFLFVKNDELFLFYEFMPIGNGLGVIKMTHTADLKHWSRPIQITNEPRCHFSYPFVFEDNGAVYMLPETGCDHNIRLYRAMGDDLTEWRMDTVLLDREKDAQENIIFDFADSCIYNKNGIYYLFTSYLKGEKYFLELYFSNNLNGPYSLHPMSPVYIGNKYGRCAGSLIEAHGKIYRPAQDCMTTYGRQVHLLEIDELSPEIYREHLVKENILPENEAFYHNGGHQINFAQDYCGDRRRLSYFVPARENPYKDT